jgi:hypothetical protein
MMTPVEPRDASFGRIASPLVIPVQPEPGALIPEIVLTAAAINRYRNVGLVLSAAAIEYRGHPAISAKSQGRERELSITLGVGEPELRRAIPYPVRDRPGWSDFFGVPLRDIHRSMEHRRVSPRSLKRSLNLKSIWSVRVLTFDPHTKEKLLERCPECGHRPTYLRTYGIEYCEFCSALDELGDTCGKVDFRDYPQDTIEAPDLEAIDFVTDLIDPEARNPSRCRQLHPDLCNLGPSTLFEFVVALGLATTSKPSPTSRLTGRHTIDYSRFEPEVLTQVGRSLLDWPRGFDRLADTVRANADGRDASYGVQKELGPLNALINNRNLPDVLRSRCKIMIRENMRSCAAAFDLVRHPTHRPSSDMVSIQQAAAKHRVARKSLSVLADRKIIPSIRPTGKDRLPRLVSDTEVAKLVQQKELAVSNSEVAVRLGIERTFVADIGRCGLITPVAKPHLASAGREFFERKSLDVLEERCRDLAVRVPLDGDVSIAVAVARLGMSFANPWPSVISKLLSEELQVGLILRKSLMRSLVLEDAGTLEAVGISGIPVGGNLNFPLTTSDGAALIGIDNVKFAQLIAQDLLPRNPMMEDLRKFAKEYMFTSEIRRSAAQFGIKMRWPEVPALLRSRGVHPVAALIEARGYVWRRLEVLQTLEAVRAAIV